MPSIRVSRSLWAFGLLALAGCSGVEQAVWQEAFPTFMKHTIAELDGDPTRLPLMSMVTGCKTS